MSSDSAAPNVSLADLAQEFFRKRTFRPKTTRDYRKYIAEYIEFLKRGDGTALSTGLTLDSAIKWRFKLVGRSEHVARLGTEALRTFAVWLAQNGHCVDPLSGRSVLLGLERTKTTSRKRQALSDEQLDATWVALGERDNRDRSRGIAYARLIYATGLRGADLRGTLRRNFDPGSRWLTVAVHRGSGTSVRGFRLDRICAAAIDDYLNAPQRGQFHDEPPEPLFIREDGLTFTENGFTSWVARVSTDVRKLTGLPWNSGRVTFTAQEHARSKIRDGELRRRCSGLLAAESDHDQAITAACIVLEDRVRKKSAGAGHFSDDLMKWAFADPPKPPRLELATDPTEQWGALNTYRGVYAFYRNGTAHRTRPKDFDPDEALRIVAWIDHLLELIE